MSWYSRAVLPTLLDWAMAADAFTEQRRSLLSQASGRVLEIGFGTGLNIPHYNPERVQTLVALDNNPGMHSLAARRLANSTLDVEHRVLNVKMLPYPDDVFDCAVSTWTLCSVKHIHQALAEIYRVLKPGGSFLFLEHGLSPDTDVQKWQHRLTPVQKAIADGCHLDRNISAAIERHPFTLEQIDCCYLKNLPKVAGYTYRGKAKKCTAQT